MKSLIHLVRNILIDSLFGRRQQLTPLHRRVRWEEFERMINYKVRNKDLFTQALIHRSFSNFMGMLPHTTNERLEFLGDAVLNLIVAEYLFTLFPEKPEGDLTVLRSRLVNKKALVVYANEINLIQFVLRSTGTNETAVKAVESIISDAYESIIAAMYLDGGIEVARTFIMRQLPKAIELGLLESSDNFKSELLEYTQARGLGPPRYVVLKDEGPDHDRTFTVEVFLLTRSFGVGVGKSKKDGEQAAAEIALARIRENEADVPLPESSSKE